MNAIKKNIRHITGGFLAFISIDGYRRTFMNDNYEIIKKEIEMKTSHLEDQMAKLEESKAFSNEKINSVKNNLEVLNTKMLEQKEILEQRLNQIDEFNNQIKNNNDSSAIVETIKETITNREKDISTIILECSKTLNETLEEIDRITKNKFLDTFIEDFKNYLSTLNVVEIGAFAHIMVNIVILFSIWNIFTILLGNKIIDLLKLEIRYPKIAKYLKYRAQLQTFNLFVNFFVMFFFLFYIIYTDICVLLKI